MIILDSTLKSLEVKLAGAITTSQLPYNVSFVEVDQTTFAATAATGGDGATNSGTAVTMVAAPASGKSRQVKLVTVYNGDTAAATVSIQVNDNGTARILTKVTLAVGDSLQYVG